jgi:hypothetical protein
MQSTAASVSSVVKDLVVFVVAGTVEPAKELTWGSIRPCPAFIRPCPCPTLLHVSSGSARSLRGLTRFVAPDRIAVNPDNFHRD